MTALHIVFGNGILVSVGVLAGVAVFAALAFAWVHDEFSDLFGRDGKHKGKP